MTIATADPQRAGSGQQGHVAGVSGPVVTVAGLSDARMFDVLRIGADRLMAEVVRIDGSHVLAQVVEDTGGLRVGDSVEGTGTPLRVTLGPGLLGSIIDGTGRPLSVIAEQAGSPFIPRGADPPPLDTARRWDFRPRITPGDRVSPGDLLGVVAETAALEHRIILPPRHPGGTITAVSTGPASIADAVVHVDGSPVGMSHTWPVRDPRPVAGRLPLDQPLVTGQRVLDVLFPVALGGAAVIPGGFGTGKTMTEQALAKHATADVVVYIGCGERGNEIAEVLEEFPQLTDPRTGAPLMERTVLIANTSNMPVAAREASIYIGITIAEYFRDQGYDVALMADSTSRWGEALREVSTRLEEIPAEDGYPAYLAARLAGFYERAGRVRCLGSDDRTGSVTVVGAVSPAGGDFSEPITQNSLRLAGTFWALDTTLARQRHYPAVNWTRSYSQYDLGPWFDHHVASDWSALRAWALAVLQQESSLSDIVALLGVESLAPEQRIVLRTGRLLREDVLQQSSFDEVDASCPPEKAVLLMRVVRAADEAMLAALARGVAAETVVAAPLLGELAAMKRWPVAAAADAATALIDRITAAAAQLSIDSDPATTGEAPPAITPNSSPDGGRP